MALSPGHHLAGDGKPKVRLLRRSKRVWSISNAEDNLIGSPGSNTFTWYRPRRIKQGTRLTLQVSLLAEGANKARAFVVRAL
jgi:hypothetical protein